MVMEVVDVVVITSEDERVKSKTQSPHLWAPEEEYLRFRLLISSASTSRMLLTTQMVG